MVAILAVVSAVALLAGLGAVVAVLANVGAVALHALVFFLFAVAGRLLDRGVLSGRLVSCCLLGVFVFVLARAVLVIDAKVLMVLVATAPTGALVILVATRLGVRHSRGGR